MKKYNKIICILIQKLAKIDTVTTLCVISSLLFVTANCEKHNSTHLQGTKWKLEGIVNEKTGVMQVLEPVDCEECYTFAFDSDTHGTGKTTTNILQISLNTPPYLGIATEVGEMGDGYLFSNALCYIDRYKYNKKNEKLSFYYQNENVNYCLTFKKL